MAVKTVTRTALLMELTAATRTYVNLLRIHGNNEKRWSDEVDARVSEVRQRIYRIEQRLDSRYGQ